MLQEVSPLPASPSPHACTQTHRGMKALEESTKDTSVFSPLVCSHTSPGLTERMGKLLAAITRKRKLLILKSLALKTEIASEIWEEMVCHCSDRYVAAQSCKTV